MNRKLFAIALIGALCIALNQSDATLHRFLSRRYAQEKEESTTTVSSGTTGSDSGTPKPSQQSNDVNKDSSTDKPARLYPDLGAPGAENNGPPATPFGGLLPPAIRGPTPFLPFNRPGLGPQNPGPLNMNYQPNFPFAGPQHNPALANQPNPNAFSSALGERLLKLANGGSAPGNLTETRQALQNATVLDQLNRGVHSVYDNLAKAYNSTIQRQVNLLQERLRNSTQDGNPWQKRWAEQMSQFYSSMANRASQAQQSMNQAWNRFRNTNKTEIEKTLAQQQQQQFQSPFGNLQALQGDGLFPELQRSLNLQIPATLDQFNGQPQDMGHGMGQQDMTTQLRDFWNSQVRPQMNSARNMISRTWHDLTASGAYNPFQMGDSNMRSRSGNSSSSSPGGDMVENILSMINLSGPEYTMIDQDDNNTHTKSSNRAHGFVNAMQDNMINMQRDINHLWKSLTNSLQSTLDNMNKKSMTRNQASNVPATSASNPTPTTEKMEQPDPAENEISGKLRDINSLQGEADKVYAAVQREQYNQKLQQEQKSVSDRLKSFYDNLHIDDNVNKLGNVVNDFWNRIPDQWNNMMTNLRNPSSTAKPTV